MKAQVFAAAAAAALVLLPAVARADLYVNEQGLNSQGKPLGCYYERSSGDGKWHVYRCSPGHGKFYFTPYSMKRSGRCTLEWDGDKHWHATWIENSAGCKMYWQNGNTLDVSLPFP